MLINGVECEYRSERVPLPANEHCLERYTHIWKPTPLRSSDPHGSHGGNVDALINLDLAEAGSGMASFRNARGDHVLIQRVIDGREATGIVRRSRGRYYVQARCGCGEVTQIVLSKWRDGNATRCPLCTREIARREHAGFVAACQQREVDPRERRSQLRAAANVMADVDARRVA